MHLRTVAVIAATALAAAAAWPRFVVTREAQAAAEPTPAPVIADYAQRDRLIAFYEDAVRRHPDQIMTRMLASQYLQRFRERGDAGDLLRGEHAARESLALQPRGNAAAEMALASSQTSLHRFRAALAHARRALEIAPSGRAALAQVASTEVELGRYDEARRTLDAAERGGAVSADDVALATATARYDEITGNVGRARRSVERAMAQVDAVIDSPAESRAWYHFRAGELAWIAGDGDAAERRYREALAIFPSYPRALNGLARVYWGERRWREALDAATRAANLVPLPETLGYEADAQRALGDENGARATDDLIGAIARTANSVDDRALAVYFADHRIHAAEAVAIARRDVAARDDVFAEDTLAWALERAGRCTEARSAARKAVRANTQDARLQYHAGVIALECGDRSEGMKRLRAALASNPAFDPAGAEEARRLLAYGSVSGR
ncbi:MAG TPA: tetratricopeptide repeat protein [Candidatus Limnocylindrales bacterium]|nr:tetratricopeptide repeat protein [Candidatus Limnocylindrales bacterium]